MHGGQWLPIGIVRAERESREIVWWGLYNTPVCVWPFQSRSAKPHTHRERERESEGRREQVLSHITHYHTHALPHTHTLYYTTHTHTHTHCPYTRYHPHTHYTTLHTLHYIHMLPTHTHYHTHTHNLFVFTWRVETPTISFYTLPYTTLHTYMCRTDH